MSSNHTGVLLIAHGSSNPRWEKDIEFAIGQVETELPIVVSYLEFTEEKTIKKGVRELENRGIETIIAIPIFISSGSTHIDEIKYALGVIEHTPIDTDLTRIQTDSHLIWCDPMDDHPAVLELLVERVNSLSVEPKNESLLIVAHGSDESNFHEIWENLLERIKENISQHFSFQEVVHGTLHPDNLRETAESLSNESTILVLPLFLCEGYFTNKVVPSRLEGLSYKWEGKTYLPHPLVSTWIDDQVKSALAKK
jgi:sirohydrochlorin cobaltochelatase